MDRNFYLRLAGSLVGMALAFHGAAAGAQGHAAERHEDVYYVRHQIGPVDGPPLVTEQALVPVALDVDASGRRLRARTAWFKVNARSFGRYGDSSSLDPDDEEDMALVGFLSSGMETRWDRKGRLVGHGPVDPGAWAALGQYRPQLHEALARVVEGTGVGQYALPGKLEVGQLLRQTLEIPGVGEVAWSMQVIAVDQERVELRMQGKAKGWPGLDGVQIVERRSGLPVEARMSLALPEGMLPGEHRPLRMEVLAISQRRVAMMGSMNWDGDTWNQYRDNFAKLADSPLFGEGALDARELVEVDTAIDRLALAELPAGAPERIRGSLMFRLEDNYTPRRQVRLRGQYVVPPANGWPGRFWMRLDGVRLLDASGQPLPGLAPVPDRRFELSTGDVDLDLGENDDQFPFRLPPGLRDAALDRLDHIELDVRLGAHVLSSSYLVDAGQQPATGALKLEWSANRVELTAAGAPEEDAWLLVPLDSQGKQMRHVPLIYSSHVAQAGGRSPPPLGSQAASWHYRVATEAPVAAVELRRYSLQWLADTWRFANATKAVVGDALVGHRHAPEPLHWPTTPVSGEALLAAFDTLVATPDGYEILVPLHGELADTAVQFCRTEVQVDLPVLSQTYRRSRQDSFRSGDPGWVGWSVDNHGFDGDDVRISAICPTRLAPVRERLGQEGCFSDQGNGWIGIAEPCVGMVARARESGALVGRDSKGRPLEEFPPEYTLGDRSLLRFQGQVDAIEYVKVDPGVVRRELVLRGGAVH